MSDREDAFRGYSSIPNKTFTDLKTDIAVKPVIKKEPSLIDRFGSIFSPRPAMAEESNIIHKKLISNINKIAPPESVQPRVIVISSATSKSKNSSIVSKSQSAPGFSASHPSGNSRNANIYGLK
jgi:hypothetical protein